MRYKSKLDFEINVDKGILSYKVIKIILQPLGENAIYHGIRNNAGKGIIQITGYVRGTVFFFRSLIMDIGMSPEEIHNMYQKDRTSVRGSGYRRAKCGSKNQTPFWRSDMGCISRVN